MSRSGSRRFVNITAPLLLWCFRQVPLAFWRWSMATSSWSSSIGVCADGILNPSTPLKRLLVGSRWKSRHKCAVVRHKSTWLTKFDGLVEWRAAMVICLRIWKPRVVLEILFSTRPTSSCSLCWKTLGVLFGKSSVYSILSSLHSQLRLEETSYDLRPRRVVLLDTSLAWPDPIKLSTANFLLSSAVITLCNQG